MGMEKQKITDSPSPWFHTGAGKAEALEESRKRMEDAGVGIVAIDPDAELAEMKKQMEQAGT